MQINTSKSEKVQILEKTVEFMNEQVDGRANNMDCELQLLLKLVLQF